MPIAEFDTTSYFPHLSDFKHKEILDDLELPWDLLSRIENYICHHLESESSSYSEREVDGLKVFTRKLGFEETGFQVEQLVEIAEPTRVAGTDILLESGVVLEPGATIKGAALIGANSEVRQGAYIRGNVLTGEHCTLGHTTEVKNSIFMNHTEAGHFAYVGDSVLGSYVNLGAGTKLANLQLRKAADKVKGNFPLIRLKVAGERINTGLSKIGAFIGDHAELGCNCVTAPAVFLGAHCWVSSNFTVVKGFYRSRTVLR